MATETTTRLVDDLDGTTAESTIHFSYNGSAYEIDLNSKNTGALEKALEKYVSAARKVNKNGKVVKKVATGPDPKAVRAWAKANGVAVPTTGRIPEAVVAQFSAAGN